MMECFVDITWQVRADTAKVVPRRLRATPKSLGPWRYATRAACWIASLLEAITPMSSFHDLTNDFAPSS
jgi:hypothetical protein